MSAKVFKKPLANGSKVSFTDSVTKAELIGRVDHCTVGTAYIKVDGEEGVSPRICAVAPFMINRVIEE